VILVYLLLLALFLVTGMRLSRVKINNRFQNVLSPGLVLVVSYCMYSVAMPVSRLFFTNTDTDYDVEYMEVQILGAAGILIGLYFQRLYHRFKKNRNSAQVLQTYMPMPAIVIMTVAVGMVMFFALKGLGWEFSAIFNPRSYVASPQTGNPEQTLFGAILWVLAISSTVLAFIGANNTKNRKLLIFTLSVVGLFCTYYLLRGARLNAGMMVLPLICVYLYLKPINRKTFLLSCLGLYFFIYAVGLVRDVGFARIADVSFKIQEFDPLTQEFGTNYSVFTKWKLMGQDNASLLLGKSYTTDVLYNMVPRYFWPERPDTAAVQFSMDYYGVSNASELTSAFGFSPVVEALVNFGVIGLVPVFALFSFLVGLFEIWFMRKGVWGLACYAFMIPMVINWNRMDMAIAVKIFIIYLVVSKFFSLLMYRGRTV